MLYFAFELDEDKIREMGYNVASAYKAIDDTYKKIDGELAFIKDNIRYYTRNKKDGDDFQYLWMVNLGFEKEEWFMKSVKGWEFIKVDENNKAYYAEDLIKNVRIL